MIQPVLVNLRIRSLTVRRPGEEPVKIDNSNTRFTKVVEMSAIPKPGAVLQLSAGPDQRPFEAEVQRAAWDDRENMFVVACSYTKSPMVPADYDAISTGGDWTMKALL